MHNFVTMGISSTSRVSAVVLNSGTGSNWMLPLKVAAKFKSQLEVFVYRGCVHRPVYSVQFRAMHI